MSRNSEQFPDNKKDNLDRKNGPLGIQTDNLAKKDTFSGKGLKNMMRS